MGDSNKLYFQFAISDVRKALDATKKEVEQWAKNNPILLEVRFKNLKSQLEAIKAVFGDNSQLTSLGREIDNVFGKVSSGARRVKQETAEMADAMRKLEMAGANETQHLNWLNQNKGNINQTIHDIERLNEEIREHKRLIEKGVVIRNDPSLLPNSVSLKQQEVAELEKRLAQLRAARPQLERNLSQAMQERMKVQSDVARLERESTTNINNTTAALSSQSQVLSDLRTMAMQYVSVWGAKTFIDNIIEQGGQLEQQRLSIGAILQDAAHANELFGKIKSLAIISPFGVTELDAMTKQLSAYGFKYNELYDMTKRLADISAATGTEVSRLALALGHVRSEGALSGYTLRQFSMGNIPLLEKLSEKIGVTTKEIRKMVSKKEIGYDEVLEVMKELTDEGGMFYNAQETMSQALNAKFKNLRDSFQIMYSEMAEGAPGTFLKGVAETLTELSRNWRILMPMLAAGAGALGVQKVATMALNYELSKEGVLTSKAAAQKAKYAAATNTAIAATGRWTLALRGAGRALMSVGKFLISPWTLGFAAVEGLIYLWQKHNQEVEKAKELTNSFRLTGSEGERNLTERMTGIDPYKKGMSESELKQGIDSMTQTLKDYGKGLNVAKTLQEAFGTADGGNVKSLAEQYEFLRGKMEDTIDVYKELQRTAGSFEYGINEADGGWLEDNVVTDLTQFSDALKNFDDEVTRYSTKYGDAIKKAVEAATEADPKFAKATENMASYGEKLAELWDNQQKYEQGIAATRPYTLKADPEGWLELGESYSNYVSKKNEAMKELDQFMAGVEEKLGYDMKDLSKTQVSNLLKQTHDWLDGHPEWNNIIGVIRQKIEGRWPIKLEPEIEDDKRPLEDWLQQMHDWLKSHDSSLAVKLKPGMSREDVIKLVHDKIKETQTVIDNTSPILLRFGVDLSNIPEELPIGLRTPWGRKQAADYPVAAKENKTDKDFIKEFGLPQPKAKSGSGRKEDKALKAAKTRLEETKAFLSEYKKYREVYGKERAINILEDLFPTTKGRGQQIVDNYKSQLEQIKNSLKLTTEERKKFGIDIDKLISDTNLTEAKEKIDRQMKEMERYIGDSMEQFNLYKSLFEKTGSKEFAMSAFSNGTMWDDAATSLANILREKMGEKGGILDWDADKQSAEDWFKKNFENGEELYKMWEKIVDLIKGNYRNALTNAADSMKDSMTYAERIAAIQAKYVEKNKNTVTDSEKYANQKAEESEIARVRIDEFKDSINWDAVFGSLQTYTKKALVDVRKSLREFVRLNRQNMDVQQLKEVETAIANLDEVIAEKSGVFGGLRESIEAYRKATEELTEAEKNYQETVKKYGANSIQAQDAKKIVNQAQSNVNNSQANVTKSSEKTMSKLASISQALVSLGKSGEVTLTDVGNVVGTLITALSSTNTAIGNLIAAIFAILDSLGDQGLDKFLGNILDKVGHAVGGILSGVGNIFGGIFGDGHAFDFIKDDLFGDGYKRYEEAKAKYESLIKTWDALFEKKKEYLNQKWGIEAQNAGNEALALLNAELRIKKILALQRLDAGASMGSHSLWYRMWKGSYQSTAADNIGPLNDGVKKWKINWQDVNQAISRQLGVTFNEMEDMLNMTSEQLTWIKTNYSGLWSQMDGDFQQYLEDIIEFGETESEILDKIKEKLTGWKLDTIKTEWADLMASLDKSSDALAENLEEKLRNAILNSMIENLYAKKIQEMINSASVNEKYLDRNGQVQTHHYDADGNITDTDVASEFTKEEWDNLMSMGQALSIEAAAMRDMLKDYYGWSELGGESSSTGNSIKGITENTADLLAGYINAIRADVSVIRADSDTYLPYLAGQGSDYSSPSLTRSVSDSGLTVGSGMSEEEDPLLSGVGDIRDYVGSWSVMAQQYYKSMLDVTTTANHSLSNIEQHAREIMISNNAINAHTAAIEKNTAAQLDIMKQLRNGTWKVPVK